MKVIRKDNLDRDEISERLVAENLTEEEAKKMAADLNLKGGEYDPWFYKAVANDYELYRFEY